MTEPLLLEPTLEAIRATRVRLVERVLTTPVRLWQDGALSRVVGPQTRVFLKEELFQRTGSFKPSGALAVMLDLAPHELARGVTAVSAGNHAMAVAYAAAALGTTAKVVMPKSASPFRVEGCRGLGATVELVDNVHQRWDLVASVKRAVRVPVLGSGDVWTAAVALRMRRETGCDAVLVARGACGNPWIFRELRAAERGEPAPPPPSRGEWMATVLRHLRMQIEHRGSQPRWAGRPEDAERQAVRELRRHLLWYSRGRRGGVRFRREATAAGTLAEVRGMLARHIADGASFEVDPSLLAAEAIAE